MKLLLVEDNLQMRQMIRRVVSDLAVEICECADDREAVALYTQIQPDWVLMDIELVHGNGINATRLIKADFPDARILIVTNYNDAMLRAVATQAGACGYVLKENLLEVRTLLQDQLPLRTARPANVFPFNIDLEGEL